MKCRCCGETVRCRGCGALVLSSQAKACRDRKRRGLCARCPNRLSKRDVLLEHALCFDCREKQAERSRRRYAAKGRTDRQRAA